MPKRPVYQTATGSTGHWSIGNLGVETECGREIYNLAPKIWKMRCANCAAVVKKRQGRAISNAARSRR